MMGYCLGPDAKITDFSFGSSNCCGAIGGAVSDAPLFSSPYDIGPLLSYKGNAVTPPPNSQDIVMYPMEYPGTTSTAKAYIIHNNTAVELGTSILATSALTYSDAESMVSAPVGVFKRADRTNLISSFSAKRNSGSQIHIEFSGYSEVNVYYATGSDLQLTGTPTTAGVTAGGYINLAADQKYYIALAKGDLNSQTGLYENEYWVTDILMIDLKNPVFGLTEITLPVPSASISVDGTGNVTIKGTVTQADNVFAVKYSDTLAGISGHPPSYTTGDDAQPGAWHYFAVASKHFPIIHGSKYTTDNSQPWKFLRNSQFMYLWKNSDGVTIGGWPKLLPEYLQNGGPAGIPLTGVAGYPKASLFSIGLCDGGEFYHAENRVAGGGSIVLDVYKLNAETKMWEMYDTLPTGGTLVAAIQDRLIIQGNPQGEVPGLLQNQTANISKYDVGTKTLTSLFTYSFYTSTGQSGGDQTWTTYSKFCLARRTGKSNISDDFFLYALKEEAVRVDSGAGVWPQVDSEVDDTATYSIVEIDVNTGAENLVVSVNYHQYTHFAARWDDLLGGWTDITANERNETGSKLETLYGGNCNCLLFRQRTYTDYGVSATQLKIASTLQAPA